MQSQPSALHYLTRGRPATLPLQFNFGMHAPFPPSLPPFLLPSSTVSPISSPFFLLLVKDAEAGGAQVKRAHCNVLA